MEIWNSPSIILACASLFFTIAIASLGFIWKSSSKKLEDDRKSLSKYVGDISSIVDKMSKSIDELTKKLSEVVDKFYVLQLDHATSRERLQTKLDAMDKRIQDIESDILRMTERLFKKG